MYKSDMKQKMLQLQLKCKPPTELDFLNLKRMPVNIIKDPNNIALKDSPTPTIKINKQHMRNTIVMGNLRHTEWTISSSLMFFFHFFAISHSVNF